MGFQLYALIQVSRSIYPYITQINQKDLPSNHCSYTINFSSLTECFRRHDRISDIINYQETVCLLLIWSEFGFSTWGLESNTLWIYGTIY